MSEHYFGEFSVSDWELNLLRKYDRVSLVAKYSKQNVSIHYLEFFAKRVLYNAFPESALRLKVSDMDALISILDRFVFLNEKIWLQSVKLMMGKTLAETFKELEDWSTKLSPDYYGSWPENEDKAVRAVLSGIKAIYHVDCFFEEECETFFKYVSELSPDLEVILNYREYKNLEYTSCFVVRRGNHRYMELLQWVFDHKDSLLSDNYHWATGIIFGYPDNDIEDFVEMKYNEESQ